MIIRSIEDIIQMLDADYMEQNDLQQQIQGVSIDSRTILPNQLYIPIQGENHNGHKYAQDAIEKGAIAVLWQRNEPNPPKDVTVIFVDDTLKALQMLAHIYRKQLHCKVIAITGSNGKTSTKDIMAAMLSKQYLTQKTLKNLNNEIGVALTLLSCSEYCEVLVVELGMENLGEIALLSKIVEPDFAIITNVGTAHLENLGSIENIAKAKMEILSGMSNKGLLLMNGDQELLRNAYRQDSQQNVPMISFGQGSNNTIILNYAKQEMKGLQFALQHDTRSFQLPMLGKHQAMNALPCLYIARLLKVEDSMIQEGLDAMEKTDMRNDLKKVNQAYVLDDSYKSNPQSAIAAVETLCDLQSEYAIVVMADMLDLGKESALIHYQLGKTIASYPVQEVVTYGEMGAYIAQGVFTNNKQIIVNHFQRQEDVISYVKPFVYKNCTILVKGSRGLHMEYVVHALCKEGEKVK